MRGHILSIITLLLRSIYVDPLKSLFRFNHNRYIHLFSLLIRLITNYENMYIKE